MSYEYFWSLTWYEWGFESLRIIDMDKQEARQRELMMELTGEFMALFANANRDPKKTSPFKRSDFFKLSYDTILLEEVDPDLYNKVARRLGSRIKGKDGN